MSFLRSTFFAASAAIARLTVTFSTDFVTCQGVCSKTGTSEFAVWTELFTSAFWESNVSSFYKGKLISLLYKAILSVCMYVDYSRIPALVFILLISGFPIMIPNFSERSFCHDWAKPEVQLSKT